MEAGDSGGTTSGQIRIDDGNNMFRFIGGTPATSFNGAKIPRTVDLPSLTAATISYSIAESRLGSSDEFDNVFSSP